MMFEVSQDYAARHGIQSKAYPMIDTDAKAADVVRRIEQHITGKTVVELGGGCGLLALHMGGIAKRVYCIEANPLWAREFTERLLKDKPANVSYLFGAADEFTDTIKGGVAVFSTNSAIHPMRWIAMKFAPVVIDVWRGA